MDDYLQIRLLHRDGLSARDIARRLRCGRDTVRKALLNASPPGYTLTTLRACPKLTDAVQSLILSILKDDQSAPRKQRHTAMRLYTRLRDEHGYAGRYDQVRRFICKHRRREREVAFETVTVKAYLSEVVIVHRGEVVARHARSRTPGQQVLEPLHYLSVLGRKPVYLDKTRLFAEWKLPAAFARLRSAFERRHGPRTGARHYIRVLQLLAGHSVEAVEGAIADLMTPPGADGRDHRRQAGREPVGTRPRDALVNTERSRAAAGPAAVRSTVVPTTRRTR